MRNSGCDFRNPGTESALCLIVTAARSFMTANMIGALRRVAGLLYCSFMTRAKAVQTGMRRALIVAWLGSSALQAQSSYEEYFDARNVPVVRGLLEKGDYENCLRACSIAIERGQPSPEWPVMRLAALAELGRTGEALSAAEDAMNSH